MGEVRGCARIVQQGRFEPNSGQRLRACTQVGMQQVGGIGRVLLRLRAIVSAPMTC